MLRIRRLDSSLSRIMPSMLSYSNSLTYAPISAICNMQVSQIMDLSQRLNVNLIVRTCLTLTMTKLSTSGYFSS